jgi:hypothetical protein
MWPENRHAATVCVLSQLEAVRMSTGEITYAEWLAMRKAMER